MNYRFLFNHSFKNQKSHFKHLWRDKFTPTKRFLPNNTRQIGQLNRPPKLTQVTRQQTKIHWKQRTPKITAKPWLALIESFIRYHGNCKYRTPPNHVYSSLITINVRTHILIQYWLFRICLKMPYNTVNISIVFPFKWFDSLTAVVLFRSFPRHSKTNSSPLTIKTPDTRQVRCKPSPGLLLE